MYNIAVGYKGENKMQYTFEGKKIVDGNRTFLDIPFNMWDITGRTGNIPVKVNADGILFECKLIPKGNGRYYIPVKKAIAGKLKETFEVSFEVVDIGKLKRRLGNTI